MNQSVQPCSHVDQHLNLIIASVCAPALGSINSTLFPEFQPERLSLFHEPASLASSLTSPSVLFTSLSAPLTSPTATSASHAATLTSP